MIVGTFNTASGRQETGSGGQFWESRSEDNIPKFVKANDDYVAKGYRLDRVAVAH